MQDLFAQLDAINAQVNLHRSAYRWANNNERWSCVIKHESDGVALEVSSGDLATAEEALEAACNKFFAAAKRGVALPLIVDHSQGERPDDDIPF